MAWTKRQLVEDAYGELALAGYVFDLTPEELQSALRRMDAMVASWEARGIRLGYAMPAGPTSSSLDDVSGVPDRAVEAVYTNLAVRLAAGLGKQLPVELKGRARETYEALLLPAAQPQQQPTAGWVPAGAGAKAYRTDHAFITPTADPAAGALDFLE